MVRKYRKPMKESYSDINQYNVWEAYEIALEYLGAEELCESFARAMGTDALEANLKYIFRTQEIPFMVDDFYEESVRRSKKRSMKEYAGSDKLYTVSPTEDGLFDVVVYENSAEVDYYTVDKVELEDLVAKLESNGYERELTDEEEEDLYWKRMRSGRDYNESIDLEAGGYEQVSGSPGYNLYRKVIRDDNGKVVKGVWAAQKYDGKTGRTVGEPFEITYDQARGFEPIGDDESLGAKVGKALGLRRESSGRATRKGSVIKEGISDSLMLKLEDFAQEYGGIDYNDISSLNGCWDSLDATTKKNIKGLISQINKACKETGLDSWELSSEYPEDKEKCEKLVKTIKGACK